MDIKSIEQRVVVIHGSDRQIYLEVEGAEKTQLVRVGRNVYNQPVNSPESRFRYTTDTSPETFWRAVESFGINHIYGKENTVLTPPDYKPILDVSMENPDLRPPKGELFDDSQLTSLILYTDGDEGYEYATGTCSFISNKEAHIDLPCKIRWAGQGSSSYTPHNYKIHLDKKLNGFPIIYAKKNHQDDTFIKEKIARDIGFAIGCFDLRSSYTFLTSNGNDYSLYVMLERYSNSNMSAFIGHEDNNVKAPGSYVKIKIGSMGSVLGFSDGNFSVEYQNPGQSEIVPFLRDMAPQILSDDSLSYEEFKEYYDLEKLARDMAHCVLICNRDSFFQRQVNFYYGLSMPKGVISLHIWDFDISLGASVWSDNPMFPPDIEYIENGYSEDTRSETYWCKRYPEFINTFKDILDKYIKSDLPNEISARIDYFANFVYETDASNHNPDDAATLNTNKAILEGIIKEYLEIE